ncbi:hypothetical protein AB4152_04015, partial [Vibrio breoganii]
RHPGNYVSSYPGSWWELILSFADSKILDKHCVFSSMTVFVLFLVLTIQSITPQTRHPGNNASSYPGTW